MTPPSGLHRLTYVSRAKSPDRVETCDCIDEIVHASQSKNTHSNVSGLLIEVSGYFIQILEGNARVLEATFERICCDLRHQNLQVLDFSPADHREFQDWAMKSISSRTASHADALENLRVSLQQGMTPGALLRGALGILELETSVAPL